MLAEEVVLSVLAGASPYATDADDRVFAVLAPQDTPLPRITFQRVSSAPVTDFQGNSNLDQVRIQVDCWAAGYLDARNLATQVRAALEANELKFLLVTDQDDYEPETRIYRVRQDFRCWHRPVA